jgi:hypothetical protein
VLGTVLVWVEFLRTAQCSPHVSEGCCKCCERSRDTGSALVGEAHSPQRAEQQEWGRRSAGADSQSAQHSPQPPHLDGPQLCGRQQRRERPTVRVRARHAAELAQVGRRRPHRHAHAARVLPRAAVLHTDRPARPATSTQPLTPPQKKTPHPSAHIGKRALLSSKAPQHTGRRKHIIIYLSVCKHCSRHAPPFDDSAEQGPSVLFCMPVRTKCTPTGFSDGSSPEPKPTGALGGPARAAADSTDAPSPRIPI